MTRRGRQLLADMLIRPSLRVGKFRTQRQFFPNSEVIQLWTVRRAVMVQEDLEFLVFICVLLLGDEDVQEYAGRLVSRSGRISFGLSPC